VQVGMLGVLLLTLQLAAVHLARLLEHLHLACCSEVHVLHITLTWSMY
jgi:hypothetical protein